MTINTRLTRRRFLDATLAAAGGVLLGGGRPLLADATVTPVASSIAPRRISRYAKHHVQSYFSERACFVLHASEDLPQHGQSQDISPDHVTEFGRHGIRTSHTRESQPAWVVLSQSDWC